MNETEKLNCPNCGAPITTEICPYCNTPTGLNTATANMEYPVIDCKEARLGFINVVFPMIFAFAFGFFGFLFPLIFAGQEGSRMVIIMSIPFAVIGTVSFIIVLVSVIRYLLVKMNGKDITGTVYGYMDDNLLINNNPAQIVKLKVETKEGPRFILYQTGDIKQPYKVNSQVDIRVYKHYFMIKKENKEYF